ncbi:MAG: flagellar basal body rod protein FlgC [Acidimicrobiales bacterium]
MPLFQALDTAVSGATMTRMWLDAIADNVANINTTRPPDEEPFRARQVIAQSVTGSDGTGRGVQVREITLNDRNPKLIYDPTHPHADEFGIVQMPNVELDQEMTNLLIANRVYGMNLAVMDRAVNAYRSALQIGR